jgi:hypothetical protein
MRSIEIIRREHQIQRESIVFIVNQVEMDELSSFQVGINKNILKNIADFQRKKQRNWRIHTQHREEYTQKMIVLHPYSWYFTHKAVRIDLRVKISWHPHHAYPPLSTHKVRPFAFTHTLRDIDPYWIPICYGRYPR